MQNTSEIILIVDDVPKNIQLLASTLSKNGYSIAAAQNGENALEKAHKIHPSLILLDVMMPGMDGFEVCQRLKQNPATQEIPVIFLTAQTETESILQGFEIGGVDYVTKPFHASELLVRVRTHLKIRSQQLKIEAQQQELAESLYEQKSLLHVLCHDLENPIGAIDTALNLITSYEDYQQFNGLIRGGVGAIKSIIQFVRKIKALRENKLQLDIVNFPLDELVTKSCKMLELKASAKNIAFSVHIDSSLEVAVESTSFVHTVLNNVLTNAIKFSFEGSTVSMESRNIEDWVVLVVEDQGIGIPPNLLNNIFAIDVPTSREGTGGEEGTGFGMPLIKLFIEAYGGKIEITSKPQSETRGESGTAVYLYIPKAA